MIGRRLTCPREGATVPKRGQSHVVGTVLMIGLTLIALAGLSAAVGGIVDDQTSRADVSRVVSDLDAAIQPVSATGHRVAEVTFTGGTLRTADRRIRVLNDTDVVATVEADALVYEHDARRAAVNAGAIVRGGPGNGWLVRDPPLTADEDVLVVGAPRLNGSASVGTNGAVTVPAVTNTSHERTSLGSDTYRVAIESRTPRAFEDLAERQGADFSVDDLDGDDVPSAVIEYDGTRRAYLVVHDLRLEVGDG